MWKNIPVHRPEIFFYIYHCIEYTMHISALTAELNCFANGLSVPEGWTSHWHKDVRCRGWNSEVYESEFRSNGPESKVRAYGPELDIRAYGPESEVRAYGPESKVRAYGPESFKSVPTGRNHI